MQSTIQTSINALPVLDYIKTADAIL